MEENNNFQYPTYKGEGFETANILERWLMPGVAEMGQFNRENYMIDKANAFNQYMYEKTLQDNSAAAQMQRAKDAGINLNLAAAGIMGTGNAVATPIQAAQGSSGMNTAVESPFDMFNKLANAGENISDTINRIGELTGFGKKNKAEIKNLNATAKKAAEEADFTYYQKRQFRRTMNILYDQAVANLDNTYTNIQNLKELNAVYQQQKYKTAAEVNYLIEQTGETKEHKKQLELENWEREFRKKFAETFGVLLNNSDMSMLIQAFLNGKGNIIINSFVDTIKQVAKELGKELRGEKSNENDKGKLLPINNETGENPNYNKGTTLDEIAKGSKNYIKRSNLEQKWLDLPEWKKKKYRKIGINTAKEFAEWIEPEYELDN